MLGRLAAIGKNANGYQAADSFLQNEICICQRISVRGGGAVCSLVVTHAFSALSGSIWENSVLFSVFFRCVKFVHQTLREQHHWLPINFKLFEVDVPLCFFFLLSGGSSDSESGASEFTLMLVWYQFVHLETAGAFLFLEYVGMKLCWPGERQQSNSVLKL